ncbi:uncharacterized protein BDW43DRAFT_266716, partial [Aspergillus alliaceus]|uniref:uncharacterized protein n=1 Tax=Petromyces alliaceus TaxID=209559 RepID=UPI0012A4046F
MLISLCRGAQTWPLYASVSCRKNDIDSHPWRPPGYVFFFSPFRISATWLTQVNNGVAFSSADHVSSP